MKVSNTDVFDIKREQEAEAERGRIRAIRVRLAVDWVIFTVRYILPALVVGGAALYIGYLFGSMLPQYVIPRFF